MENVILAINKEQYALRKLNKDISIAGKLLSEIIDKLPKEYFEKGELFFDKNEFKDAAQCYTKAIEYKSNFAIAFCRRAYSYLNLNEYYLAITDFNKALSLSPDYNDALFGRANTRISLKDYEGAIDDFSKAILSEPKDGDSYFFRGLLKEETGDIKGALEDWLKAGTNGSKFAKDVLDEKWNTILKNIESKYSSFCSIENLTNQIEKSQNDGSLFFKRGLEKAKINDYKNAISDFQKANHLYGSDKTSLNNIGMSFFYLGNQLYDSKKLDEATFNFKQAIFYCNKAIEFDSCNASAFLICGASKRMLADKIGACADLRKAHELGDKKASGFINEYCNETSQNQIQINEYLEKSDLHYKKKEFKEAIFYGNEVLELDSNSSLAHYQIGITKIALQDYAGALEALNISIQIDPTFDFAFLNRGDIKLDTNDFAGAIEDYTRAIELNRKFESAYINRGISKFELRDYNSSVSDFNKVIALNPNNLLAYHNRGKSKRYLNDDIGAINDFTTVIEHDPINAYAYFDRGATRISLSQYEEARKDLLKAGQFGYKSAYEIIDKYLKT